MKKNGTLSNIFSNKTIGRSLLLWIILFSTVVTMLLSCLQLYIDYRLELNTINNRLSEVESSYVSSLESSLWNVDADQIERQLVGIIKLPDITFASVEEKNDINQPVLIKAGQTQGADIVRDYALTYSVDGNLVEIGTLTVQASLRDVYKRLVNKAITILFTQGIKTFLVSLFILYIFHWLVTQHIVTIGNFLKNVDLKNQLEPMALNRDKANSDELDYLVDTYNTMSVNLQSTYSELQAVNLTLEEDIGARKKAEAEVKKLNDELESRVAQRTAELEAANQELGSFCYSVSHDLRAPLRRIEGFRRILESDYASKLDDTAIHYLDRIEAGTSEMNTMIESFLKLSKSTSVELVVEKINLSQLFKRAVLRLTERDNDRNVSIDIQSDIYVNGDERLLDLLVTNLVDNALKYTRQEPDASMIFSASELGGKTVYIVEDNGVGFNMDYAKKLFSPFTRLHQGDTFEGVGIGLATVQRVVARHGGHVWAESSVDNGAKFFFTLWDKEAS